VSVVCSKEPSLAAAPARAAVRGQRVRRAGCLCVGSAGCGTALETGARRRSQDLEVPLLQELAAWL